MPLTGAVTSTLRRPSTVRQCSAPLHAVTRRVYVPGASVRPSAVASNAEPAHEGDTTVAPVSSFNTLHT